MMYSPDDFPAAQRRYCVTLGVLLCCVIVCAIGYVRSSINEPALEAPIAPVQFPFAEPSMYAASGMAHRFRIVVADQVADPEVRNAILRDTGGAINDLNRIAAIGSLGTGETDGYDDDLLWIVHNIVPAAGWYTTHSGLREAMLLRCRGRVYHDDECYAAYLGAVIAHRVPNGYVAQSVTNMRRNPLRMLVNAVRALPSTLGG